MSEVVYLLCQLKGEGGNSLALLPITLKREVIAVERWTKEDIAKVQRLNYLTDLLIGIALTSAVIVCIGLVF